MTENPLSFDAEVGDHQVIIRAGQVEAVVHEARYPHGPVMMYPRARSMTTWTLCSIYDS